MMAILRWEAWGMILACTMYFVSSSRLICDTGPRRSRCVIAFTSLWWKMGGGFISTSKEVSGCIVLKCVLMVADAEIDYLLPNDEVSNIDT